MSPTKSTLKSAGPKAKTPVPKQPSAKRRSLRFNADLGDYAIICFNKNTSMFQTDAVGIILNESSSGCSLAVPATDKLQKDDIIVVQIGRLEPLPATVMWRKELDKDVVKLGLRYDE